MSTPKNGLLVLTVKSDGIEEVALQTSDGEIILQVRVLKADRVRVILSAPTSVKIGRRKKGIPDGGQGRHLPESRPAEVRS